MDGRLLRFVARQMLVWIVDRNHTTAHMLLILLFWEITWALGRNVADQVVWNVLLYACVPVLEELGVLALSLLRSLLVNMRACYSCITDRDAWWDILICGCRLIDEGLARSLDVLQDNRHFFVKESLVVVLTFDVGVDLDVRCVRWEVWAHINHAVTATVTRYWLYSFQIIRVSRGCQILDCACLTRIYGDWSNLRLNNSLAVWSYERNLVIKNLVLCSTLIWHGIWYLLVSLDSCLVLMIIDVWNLFGKSSLPFRPIGWRVTNCELFLF